MEIFIVLWTRDHPTVRILVAGSVKLPTVSKIVHALSRLSVSSKRALHAGKSRRGVYKGELVLLVVWLLLIRCAGHQPKTDQRSDASELDPCHDRSPSRGQRFSSASRFWEPCLARPTF